MSLVTLTELTKKINAVAISSDRQFVAIACHDGSIRAYSLWNWAAVGVPLRRPSRVATAVAWCQCNTYVDFNMSPSTPADNLLLISGYNDGHVVVWDAVNWRKLHEYEAHYGAVSCVAGSPGPSKHRLIASGSDCGTMRFFNLATGKLLRKTERISADAVVSIFPYVSPKKIDYFVVSTHKERRFFECTPAMTYCGVDEDVEMFDFGNSLASSASGSDSHSIWNVGHFTVAIDTFVPPIPEPYSDHERNQNSSSTDMVFVGGTRTLFRVSPWANLFEFDNHFHDVCGDLFPRAMEEKEEKEEGSSSSHVHSYSNSWCFCTAKNAGDGEAVEIVDRVNLAFIRRKTDEELEEEEEEFGAVCRTLFLDREDDYLTSDSEHDSIVGVSFVPRNSNLCPCTKYRMLVAGNTYGMGGDGGSSSSISILGSWIRLYSPSPKALRQLNLNSQEDENLAIVNIDIDDIPPVPKLSCISATYIASNYTRYYDERRRRRFAAEYETLPDGFKSQVRDHSFSQFSQRDTFLEEE